MTLETIYYIGQTIAVIAILGSLIAIYRQQKRTNQIERGKTESERANQLSIWAWNHTGDHETLQSIRRCHHDHTSAHPDDQAKFSAYMSNILELAGQAFYQQRNDLIEPTSFEGVFNLCIANLKTPGGRQWWNKSGRHLWQTDLVATLTQKIDDPNNAVPPITEISSYLRMQTDALLIDEDQIEPSTQTETEVTTS